MIQRVQSIFLFLAAACGFAVFALPFASSSSAVTTSSIFADASYSVYDHVALSVFFGLAGFLALISLFMFKNRSVQQKLCIFAIIADVIGIVLLIVFLIQDDVTMDPALIEDEAGAYLPLAFIVFGILALRYIRKDDELINSMDRLR